MNRMLEVDAEPKKTPPNSPSALLLTERLWSRLRPRATFRVVRELFPRLLAVCYIMAFASWGLQCDGLTGSDGILPAANWIEGVKDWAGGSSAKAFWEVPTIFLWHYSDSFARWVCWGGAALALLVIAGFAPGPLLLTLWLAYLSLVKTGGVFMSYQWDTLLLETGLLGALFAPWRLSTWRPGKNFPDGPWLGIILLHWLLVRLMFFSGFVKLASDDPTWRNCTALNFHYETQPLPTWLGWWAHQLPEWAHVTSCRITFLIELVLPFALLLGRWGRLGGCLGFTALMLLILLTGNYTFFNWLTIFLALTLLDDSWWPHVVKRWLRLSRTSRQPASRLAAIFTWAAGIPLLLLSLVATTMALEKPSAKKRSLVPQWARQFYAAASPFASVNSYGLFAVMTTERNEIVFEVSADGAQWHEVEFKWKPGNVRRAPGFVAPHQPRLDWQMWFAAFHPGFVPQRDMSSPRMNWFGHFVGRLLDHKKPVWELLERPPIAIESIKFVRCQFYRYRFSDLSTRRATGAWWTREYLSRYSDTFAKP
ncbi:MAG: lipase maturation factor family protein [Verrucomicrobiales bacterium]